MDGDEKGARAKKSLKGQNWLLFFLYLYILLFLQEIPGFNGFGRGEELSFKFLVSLFLLLCKVPTFSSMGMKLGICNPYTAKPVLKSYCKNGYGQTFTLILVG